MPDARKSLLQLREEWRGCMRCPLGEKRETSNGRMVFGEGVPGGILFIGEGPGVNESIEGRPFVGRSGSLLRNAINKLGLAHCSYISNVVSCRSFGPEYDNAGQLRTRFNRRTGTHDIVLKDEPPPAAAVEACLGRLYEEIYIVDPILIVTLGGEAIKALLRRSVSVKELRGTTVEIRVPGVWTVPDLTSKGNWSRKQHGQVIWPTMQNYVRYLTYIAFHPSYVLRDGANEAFGNPKQRFIEDMHMITDIYYRTLKEVHGIDGVRLTQLIPDDIIEED
jgi:uracil-DNA glycosylase